MYQSVFSFSQEDNYYEVDYVVSSVNKEAHDLISNWDNVWGVNPYENIVVLLAPPKSGKTYLSNLLISKSKGYMLRSEEILSPELLLKYSVFVVDDIKNFSEKSLFHIFNICHENGVKLLLTSSYPISMLNLALPDLESRLKSVRQVIIFPPDQEMLASILMKYSSQRSIKVSNEVLSYMLLRVPRNFSEIFKIVEKIDQISLIDKRNVTIPLIKSLLSDSNVELS